MTRGDQLVDLGAGGLGVDLAPCQKRQRFHARREITLVSYPHKIVLVPQGADEFGQGRKKADNPHEPLLSNLDFLTP